MTDPVVRNARREAIIIGSAWLASTVYCCVYSWIFGYDRPGHHPTRADVRAIWGIPSWAFWGYIVPWAVCAVFTLCFAGFYMTDDDLGRDRSDFEEGGPDA